MAYTKEKMDVVIDNVTYKNIDINVSTNWEKIKEYLINTTGVAQIIKQFVKNNYGDIKVWAKSSKFSMGSSVSVYLWKVPTEWKIKITDFAERFGMYNDRSEANGGDGYWRGAQVGATTIDGQKVGNYSPYMSVTNHAPYDSKEYDMTPPNYDEKPTPKKKEYERKGGKYSPTDNLDLVLDCGNGWKIYVGKPKEKYLYNVVKDKDTKQNTYQWAEIKADMLEAGFPWGYKSGTFQRWTTTPDDTLPQQACNVLSKYWGGSSQPKEETPKEPQVMIPQGTEFELMEDVGTLKKGDTGVFAEDYIPRYAFLDAYMNSEIRPDFIYTIPFKKIRIIEEAPREEIPKAETKKEFKVGDKVRLIKDIDKQYFPNNQELELGDIGIVKDTEGGLGIYYNIEFNGKEIYLGNAYFELVEEEILPFVKGETIQLKKEFKYDNSTLPIGLRGEIKNIDYIFKTAYVYFYGDDSGNYPVPFEYLEKFVEKDEMPKEETPKENTKFKVGDKVRLVKDIDKIYPSSNTELGDIGTIRKIPKVGMGIYYDVKFNGLVFYLGNTYLELVESETPKEVNLDEYLNDLNVLLEIEDDETKRLELATYISDLNILKLLD